MAQLNNLLVTGDSRFLNEIHGKIDWSNILSKPTIPAAANNGTLTIQKNGTNVQTFTANQNTNVTANIIVPTKVSELTNDSGYTTLTIGTTDTTAMAGNTNVNKVTSVGNHYAPTEDSSATLSADASSTTAATWNSTSLVTGVDIKRDAKGHVTGVAVDSIKMPSNPNTNTHRPIKVNGTTILGDNTAPFNLVSGDNVHMAITGSGSVTIRSDQIDDSYTYSQYQDLPSATKMQDKIFMVQDAPNPPSIPIVDEYAREQIANKKNNFTYSTTWKPTGDTWTNGKAMYRKVFTFTKIISSAGTYVLGTVDSGYAVVKMNGYFVYNKTTRFLPVANGSKTTEVYLGANGEINLRVVNDTWSNGMNIVLIMDAYKV